MNNVVVLGITADEKYAVVAKDGVGYFLGYIRESELLGTSIHGISTKQGFLCVGGFPLDIQKTIFYIIKPMLQIVSGDTMVSDLISNSLMSTIVKVEYDAYAYTWLDYCSSEELTPAVITKIPTERVSEAYEIPLMEEEFTPVTTGQLHWVSVEKASEVLPDIWPSFDQDRFDKFCNQYGMVSYCTGYNLDIPIASFLQTGADVERYSYPANGKSFREKYGLNNPKLLAGEPFFDHPQCFKDADGRVYLVLQPYMSSPDIDSISKTIISSSDVPEAFSKITFDVLGKDSSWYNPNETNVVVMYI